MDNKFTILCGQHIPSTQNHQPLSCYGFAAFYNSDITLRTGVVWSRARFMPVKIFRKQWIIPMVMVWKFCRTMCYQRKFDRRRRPGNPLKCLNHPICFMFGTKNKVTKLHEQSLFPSIRQFVFFQNKGIDMSTTPSTCHRHHHSSHGFQALHEIINEFETQVDSSTHKRPPK